ncbi:protein PFF0380w-like [Aphis gossypii]|uniref:protein PFF0380w-like n=1 Tax=Aphis gossypii TaxID=80765 RepID=UPI0021591F2A|nr:protein PFF0380w-like [Aphis gossypii]
MQSKNHKEEKKLLHSICEVNIDGKMALVSLYDDLPHFEYDQTIDNLKDSIIKLKTYNRELKQRIQQLEKENTHFKSVNMVLSKNITSLYKTASCEIQRKDKIIDDLRKSQVVSLPSTSKIFSSINDNQIEKTEVNKLSESKKNTEQIKNTVEKTKILNPNNNNDNIISTVIKPNVDVPKTVYYKRLCQKLALQNVTLECKKPIPQHTENMNTVDKIIKDKNVELNYDENILKEMTTSLIHNESKDINSTLVICEPDITPSNCELDTTPVIQCENVEKDKENVSVKSFFSKLGQPTKSKKKLIISPCTIGVQNKHPKTFKNAKKLNQINNLSSITQCENNNSPKKQIIKSLNKDNQSICVENNIPEYNQTTDNKPLTIESTSQQKNNQSTCNLDTLKRINDITESKHSSNSSKSFSKNTLIETSPANKTVIPSINNEVEQVPITRETNVIKNDDNNSLNKFNEDTQSSCLLNKDQTTKYDSKTDNNLLLKNNQKQSINIEVEQFPIRRRKAVIEKDDGKLALSNVRKHPHDTYMSPSNKNEIIKSTENVKCFSMNNNKESSSPSRQKINQSTCNLDSLKCVNDITESKHSSNSSKSFSKNTLIETSPVNKTVTLSINNEVEQVPITRETNVIKNDDNNSLNKFNEDTQSSCLLNKDQTTKYDSKTDNNLLLKNNQKQSINIEVEQFPIRRRKTVIEKDDGKLALSNVRKRPHGTYMSPSNKNEIIKSTENVKCFSMNNNKESSSPSRQKINQSTCNLDTLKCVNDITKSQHSKNSNKSSPKNTLVETSPTNKTAKPSINIEVEQVPIIRKSNVIKKDNNTLNKFNEVTQSSCLLNKDHKTKFDSKTENKLLLTDKLHDQKLSSYEKQNQTPSVNIEVEQFPIRRRKSVKEKDNNSLVLSDVKKNSHITCTSPLIKNEFNKSTENVKCLSMNNNNKESSSSFQLKNSQATCDLDTHKCANNVTESKHPNNSCKSPSKNIPVETSPTNKISIPSVNIEVEQGFIFKQSNSRKVIMHSTFDDKQGTKKGRRVQLITIQDHYSNPVPSFNGAKKTDIDVSNKSILTEKVVESSSHFFVPQVKRRRTMNFGSADS